MKKNNLTYNCNNCGASFSKWTGRCADCGEWNTLTETIAEPSSDGAGRFQGYSGTVSDIQTIDEISIDTSPRLSTGLAELDRVLGGGLVGGSVVLLGGDPGIGKSTVLLQVCGHMSRSGKVLYVTGEESAQQIAMRAARLGVTSKSLLLLTETQVENICATAGQHNPAVMVVDSIQTMQVATLQGAPGGVGQIREAAAMLTRFAKKTNTAVFLVGHVTKSGDLAGPRVLEHIIDVVCYFEGNTDSRYKMMRTVKNRFGPVNELGFFAMTDTGVKEVKNPSAILLSRSQAAMPGSTITCLWEGSRPVLIEIQALVDECYSDYPRRVTVGLEQNRLIMLLAVLHKHGNIASYNQDVFINVAGGLRITETSADLAVLMACISSFKNQLIEPDTIIFGELGLSGEVRPVAYGQERLREAAKHGFTRAIVPKANVSGLKSQGLDILPISTLTEAMQSCGIR